MRKREKKLYDQFESRQIVRIESNGKANSSHSTFTFE